jgi:hypothetical protein
LSQTKWVNTICLSNVNEDLFILIREYLEDPKPKLLACNRFHLCGVFVPQLLPSDNRELVKDELFLCLEKVSWDRICVIFE